MDETTIPVSQKSLLDLSDSERGQFTFLHALTTNLQCDEVLVGLTAEESCFYVRHLRVRSTAGHRFSKEDSARYLAMNDKHEMARLAVIAAENQLRVEHPAIH